nr:hypothetical protein [Tatlockia sp.]
GYNGFEPDKLITKTVKDSSKTRGFGVSGNLNSVTNALDSEPAKTSQLTTFSVSHEKRDYAAENRATIYGAKGQSENLKINYPHLNTSSAQSKRVTRDQAENITLDIPVEIVKTSVQASIGFFKTAKPKDQKMPVICEKMEELPETLSAPNEESASETCSEYEGVTETPNVIEPSVDIEPSAGVQQTEEKTSIQFVEIVKTADPINSIAEPIELDNAELETEIPELCETFNPDLQMQTLGMKKGRHGQQLCNKENGQYTNTEKELGISKEKNRVNVGIECVILEEGDKTDGLYYSVKVDPLTNTLIMDAGIGNQYVFNIDSKGVDLGNLGSASYRIDACSAQALINTQMELTSTSATATLGGEFGLMGPGVGCAYNSPTISFMGLSFQLSVEGSAGVGFKIAGEVGAEANARKMNISGIAKVGFFSGAGANVALKPSIGLDLYALEEHPRRVREIIENDPFVMRIYEKLKNYEPVSSWEIEEFDRAFLDADMQARFGQ